MTAQLHDKVIYQSDDFDLVGVKDGKLPIPKDYGLQPVGGYSNCDRGYIMTYLVNTARLYLSQLWIDLLIPTKDGKTWRPINNVEAEIHYSKMWGGTLREGGKQYNDIQLAVDFTGGILIARDFDGGGHAHYGFAKPFQYDTVIELMFRQGQLVQEIDRSVESVQWREAFTQQIEARNQLWQDLKQQSMSPDEIEQEVATRLTLTAYYKGVTQPYSLDYSAYFQN